jgi:TolA-binding protein
MKAQERHQLKQNEFAQTAARVAGALQENRQRAGLIAIVVIAILAIGGGWWWWNRRTNNLAGGEFGIGMAIARSPITPASTLPSAVQATGTFSSEGARHEAALKQFEKAATEYPSTAAGIAARYHAGLELLGLGRFADAEKSFQQVIDRGGAGIYGPSAKLAMAESLSQQGKYDDAIKRLTDLAGDRDGALPVDGILMQLARTNVKAGKTQDARAAYKRVVDEFPDSLYANDARQQLTHLN